MKSKLKSIVEASFIKRVFALIMDATIAGFILLGLIVLVFVPIADKTMSYSEKMATQLQYQVASGLFVYYDTDSDGNTYIYDLKDVDKLSDTATCVLISDYTDQDDSFYINQVKYYFLHYKTGVGVIYPDSGKEADFIAPNYKDLIDGKTPAELYTEEWFNAKVNELKTKEAIMELGMKDMSEQAYYMDNNKDLRNIQYFVIMPPFVISFSVFFIVIPLCFKNGETLGKKTLHLALVNKDGYTVKKKQIVYRQLLLLFYCFLCTFAGGIGLVSFATLGFGVLIYLVPTFISKTKRSPADLIAYTLLIDTLHSVWFESEYEEELKTKEVDDNLSKLHKVEIDSKNVIQVGSTIINEEIKQEVEAENKEKSI